MKPIRVIQIGLGPIGVATAKLVQQKRALRLVAAVDVRPGVGKELGVPLFISVAAAVKKHPADVAIVTTGSRFLRARALLNEIFAAGLHVVSSCEELLFPWHRHPREADATDRAARRAGVACLGTGVNPGFVMDTLAAVTSGVCQRVDAVRVWRIQDVSRRRPQLQEKVGAGMDEDEFRGLVAAGAIGHVGLQESLALIAHGLGWKLSRVTERIEPVIAPRDCASRHMRVRKGQVAGVSQVARGFRDGKEVLRLDLKMFMGAENPRDEVQISGVPPMRLIIPGATPGDHATAAILVNCVPLIVTAPPGLRTMLELPVPRAIP
ncbi:MAG: dihydrodipicolinate reductase [Verrucomicrobiae bacterium]|nr:dihydrodipicolinate reductase [Verrucomicrobiae bacterium]